MKEFLLGCLCGFVFTIIFIFIYVSLRVGGEDDE